mgnify:CR=1 FL=1
MDTKQLSRVEIKDADKGEIAAVFATFDVIDADNDVHTKSTFDDGAATAISTYGHGSSLKGDPPLGIGHIRVLDNEAVMEGRYFMDNERAASEFAAVKAMSEAGLQEWSYGLHKPQRRRGTLNGKSVNFIDHTGVNEVSPVLRGAGVATRTLAVKADLKFSEHIESVMADVDGLITRATEVMALRAQKGKGLGGESADLLTTLTADLDRLKALLETGPDPADDWQAAMDLLAASATFQGAMNP